MEPNYRRCISCRIVGPKHRFLRIVREHSTGRIVLDQGMGRSAYLCPNADCLGIAQKKKRLDRALRSAVPPDLYQALWDCIQEGSLPSRPC
ncbi:MAG: YlxR family protein [Thermosynechococcaceae cyanobacterium]